jgi:metallo-beta-lactamase family protein
MKLTFFGACQQVTGSMYLLELKSGYKILIDCGANLEKGEPFHKGFKFEPSEINLVVLTHAHIDHSGNIPNLYVEGYEGKILCTLPTYYLSGLLLYDSASLHRRKLSAAHKNRRRGRRNSNQPQHFTNGLYLEPQAKIAIEQFEPIAFNQSYKPTPEVSITFAPAGHLLGAANAIITINEDGKTTTIGFSGDIGRWDYPLLLDPQQMPQVDYLICESTYGQRLHQDPNEPERILLEIIQTACVDVAGRLIIPAFSVGRTQALLYVLNKLYLSGKLPPIKVFVDSPMAIESTKIYVDHKRFLNPEARSIADTDELFDFDNLVYVEKNQESRQISNHFEPCIIISSSGMMEGGRIQHHIRQNINNPYATVLMIGYVADDTLGRKLLDGKKNVEIDGKNYPVLANIVKTDVFSGHGDQDDLVRFVQWQDSKQLKKIFIVHGEKQSMQVFKQRLAENGYPQAIAPTYAQSFEL